MKQFFVRWLARSLKGTLLKGAVSTASLAVVSTLIFSLVSVSSGIRGQLGKELSAYGANMIVLPKTTPLQFGLGSYKIGTLGPAAEIHIDDLKILRTRFKDDVENYAPGLMGNIKVAGADAGAAGYPFGALQKLNPLWHVAPRWPKSSSEAMIGAMLANRLGIKVGDTVEVSAGDRSAEVVIAANVETGSDEDKNIFLSIELMQRLMDRSDAVSLALVRARSGGLSTDATGAAIMKAIPNVEARTLRQVAGAEESLLNKVSRLMWFVTIVVSLATAFTVAGTISVLLLGRRQEIGLCAALGARRSEMRRLFLWESAFSAIAAGAIGCSAGALVSEIISKNVFDSTIGFRPVAAALALLAPVLISVLSSLWPVKKALDVSPCEALRDQ